MMTITTVLFLTGKINVVDLIEGSINLNKFNPINYVKTKLDMLKLNSITNKEWFI